MKYEQQLKAVKELIFNKKMKLEDAIKEKLKPEEFTSDEFKSELFDCKDSLKFNVKNWVYHQIETMFSKNGNMFVLDGNEYSPEEVADHLYIVADTQGHKFEFKKILVSVNMTIKRWVDNKIKPRDKSEIYSMKDIGFNSVATGIKKLDEDLDGGFHEGLNVVIGGTNGGKSMFSISLAANAARNGKRVIYFSLEDDFGTTNSRLFANLSGIKTKLCRRGEVEKEKLDTAMTIASNIEIYSPDSMMFVEDVVRLIDEEEKKKHIDMIVIDYPGLLQMKRKNNDEERIRQRVIHLHIQLLAKRMRIPFIIPVQANRTGYTLKDEKEKAMMTSGHVAESFDIVRLAVNVVTINNFKDKDQETIIYLDKSRLAEKGVKYYIYPDKSCALMIPAGATGIEKPIITQHATDEDDLIPYDNNIIKFDGSASKKNNQKTGGE